MDTGPVPEPEVGETPTMPNGDEHAPPPEQEVAEVGEDNEVRESVFMYFAYSVCSK